MTLRIRRSSAASVMVDRSASKDSRRQCSRPVCEALKDILAGREWGPFAGLNCPEQGHVLQVFLHGCPEQIVTYFEHFNHGIFQKALDAAFFLSGHAQKLRTGASQLLSRRTEFAGAISSLVGVFNRDYSWFADGKQAVNFR